MNPGSFKNVIYEMFYTTCLIYMYKKELILNDLQWLICHKTKTKPNQKTIMWKLLVLDRNTWNHKTEYKKS